MIQLVLFLLMYVYAGVTAAYLWREYCGFAGMVSNLFNVPIGPAKEVQTWQFAVGVGAIWPLLVPIFLMVNYKMKRSVA